jgi:hypothetical protein
MSGVSLFRSFPSVLNLTLITIMFSNTKISFRTQYLVQKRDGIIVVMMMLVQMMSWKCMTSL